ncbi:MAG: RsmB/NOP family class I SAM-dependent RNA methyltransferase [Reyranellaceae bacterium]
MTPGARLQAAIDLLDDILANPRKPADATVGAFFRARRYIGGGDRRAVAERVYGILRRRAQLEWWLARAGAKGAPSGRGLVVADLALHEGLSADHVAGLFDGGRFRPQPFEREERAMLKALAGQAPDHPEQPVAVRFNIPGWIEPELRAALGEDAEREYAAMNRPAPVDLRVNLLKADRDAAQQALAAEQVRVAPTELSPVGLRAEGRPSLVTGAAFRAGLVEIQDEGSQLVALLADARPGLRVVDYCAGAGGKTLAMAAAMQNKGALIACDVSALRLERAVTRIRRAGVHNATQKLIDAAARKWLKRAAGTVDRVLVDAPCSGTGTWRRNPDARWVLQASDIDELIAKQAQILDAVAGLVKPGGKLVYATCSLLPRENEGQIEAFLARHPGFEVVKLAEAWREATGTDLPAAIPDGAHLRLTPAGQGTDGFFVGVLRRQARPEPAS